MVSFPSKIKKDLSYDIIQTKELIHECHARVTFWGGRVIEAKGKRGSVSLDFMSSRVHAAACDRSHKDDLTLEERIAGLEIVKKLLDFYKETDDQIKTRNFFTRLLLRIREFSVVPYTTRFYLEDFSSQNFRAFSKQKFAELFGPFPQTRPYIFDHPASDASFGPPLRICASEETLRALYANPQSQTISSTEQVS
jgi:hypothetical protein